MSAPTQNLQTKDDQPPAPRHFTVTKPPRWLTTTAIVSGLVGFLCFILLPILPINQTQTSFTWPQDGKLNDVSAPLTAYAPQEFDATVPLALAKELPDGQFTLLSSLPDDSEDPAENGLLVRSLDEGVTVLSRGKVILDIDSDTAKGLPDDAVLTVHSDVDGTRAEVAGATNKDGQPLAGGSDEDVRPTLTGIFTDLPKDKADSAIADGLNVQVEIDSRYTSSPTVIKYIAIWLGLLMVLVSLWALHRLDLLDGRKARRFLPHNWFKVSLLDAVVVGILAVWHFIGANTSDDGYLLGMARASHESGYMANYYRWFGVPESPFGAPYYDLLGWMTYISTSSLFMRLPALIAGILVWFLLSREVIPRLGRDIGQRKVPYWTAAFIMLAFWLPYNNGLRPEPVIALGALLTWVSIERALATGRLLPAALAVIFATISLGAGPTGLMAIAALVAGLSGLIQIVVRRLAHFGGGESTGTATNTRLVAAQVMPFLPAGTAILIAVFGDQTLRTVLESIRVRGLIGPSLSWYEEPLRYYWLVQPSVDGSFTRRFAVLFMFACVAIVLMSILRNGRVPGTAAGPASRLIFVVFGTMFFMLFTPTKWTHHFGVYAGIAAAIAAVAAMAVAAESLRSSRTRTFIFGGLLALFSFCLMGINGWWYVSSYGVPWFDKTIQLKGIEAGNVLIGVSLLVLFAGAIQSFVTDVRGEKRAKRSPNVQRRIAAISSAPIALFAGAVVLFSVLSLTKAVVSQYPAYSVGLGNLRAATGNICQQAESVLVEKDVNEGFLKPVQGELKDSLATDGARNLGPNNISSTLWAEGVGIKPGQANTENQNFGGPKIATGGSSGTQGGRLSEPGVNGSYAALPFGLDPKKVPVMGTFFASDQRYAAGNSEWFEMPERKEDSPLMVISAAGRINYHDINGVEQYGQKLVVEYGKKSDSPEAAETGGYQITGFYEPMDIGPKPSWRNLRIPMDAIPEDVDVVRIRVEDADLNQDQWLAYTPPRVPEMQSLNEFVGSDEPTLLDWAVSFQFPCQRPFTHFGGVAEIPKFRIAPDRELKVSSTDTWQSRKSGGPLGYIEANTYGVAIPSYLEHDWARDWGSIERLVPRTDAEGDEATPAKLDERQETRSGLWTPGTMRVYEE
ncbi:arabinosyltransferase domain-containing protein [Corynebacterium ulceribovis]|uniref:arabinosyltransferase domain-containing protein n=1 Tax=Corynebacterium ulceribovis TaxID=487732 RepID=UPI00035E6B23|nr:arabinosyltransferase domain-containing protein [Corynebacterium ulceribovis]